MLPLSMIFEIHNTARISWHSNTIFAQRRVTVEKWTPNKILLQQLSEHICFNLFLFFSNKDTHAKQAD